jgi:hypothetical protein
VLYAMGRDRQLPHALARIHWRYHTPYVCMIVTAAISLGVVVLGLTADICWGIDGPARGSNRGPKDSILRRRLRSGLPSAALGQYLPHDGEQDTTFHTGEIIL